MSEAAVPPSTPESAPKKQFDSVAILKKAAARAAQGGISGAAAMAINVCSLMWIRTAINYQYRYGTSTTEAFKKLYSEGGIPRFYRGLLPALVQGPLSRFGDTAANTGMITALDSFEATENLPVAVKTIAASLSAGAFRIFLMPVDTFKTTMQVEGKDAVKKLFEKYRANGIRTFYQGALASAAATFVGHYPWFFVYNYLSAVLPKYDDTIKKLGRSALIGFCSSAISDTISNSIRVVKVYKQANTNEVISYKDCVKRIIQEDGLIGLFGRGLRTKIIANGLQGLMFSVLWKLIDEQFFKKDDKKHS